MSDANLELVRRAYAANRSGPPEETLDVALTLAHPDCVFRSRVIEVEGRAYSGHEGVRAYFADMTDAWREFHNEIESMREVAPNAVLATMTFYATGRSGVEVELPGALVCVISEGKVIEMHAYSTEEEALEAAGLSE